MTDALKPCPFCGAALRIRRGVNGYSTEGRAAMIGFRLGGRYVRFQIELPDPDDQEFTHHSRGRRTADAAEKAWEQGCRQVWRALALVIKAKLEAVAAGITTVEDEFLAHTVLPDGSTFGDWAKPQIEKAYAIGAMPTSLLLGGPKENG